MSDNDPDFDARSHITAAEIRAMGIQLPDRIPDCAWIPRGSMVPDDQPPKQWMGGDVIALEMGVKFTEPFRWVEATFIVDDDKETA